MSDDLRQTKRHLPVLVGHDFQHVMARVDIQRTPDTVIITITSDGVNGQRLAEFLEQAEPIALSFGAIPVRNIREKRDNS